MTVKIGAIWDSTTQVLGGRTGVLMPIAVLGFFLPSVVQTLVGLVVDQNNVLHGGLTALIALAAAVLMIWGQMAVMAVATHPATTRADASRQGWARLLPVLGIALMIAVIAMVLFVPIFAALIAGGFDFAAAAATQGNTMAIPRLSGGASAFIALYGLALGILAIWASARLMLVYTVVLNERLGLGAIRRSIQLTRGLTLKLIGVMILFGIVFLVVLLAAQGVVGVVARLLLGSSGVAVALSGIAGAAVNAVLLTIAYVFVARLYVATAGVVAPATVDLQKDVPPAF